MASINTGLLSVAFRDKSLCARSGTCVGVCPENAISVDHDNYPVLDAAKCTQCGLCGEVCPGEKVSFAKLNMLTFGNEVDTPDFDGRVEQVLVARSANKNMQKGGAGGGVVTALLNDLLKHGDVGGCIVTRMRIDKPWLGEPFVATTEQDLLDSQGSRYITIPLNSILQFIRGSPGKYAVAALPCHVHGLRLAMEKNPGLKKTIPFVIGLFCGGALEPFVVPELLQTKNISVDEIKDFQFRGGDWPGKMRAILKDGSVRNLHYSNYKDGAYNYFIGLYMPRRCQTCIDGSGEFADVSISDAWTRDEAGNYKFESHSRILVRSKVGIRLVDNAVRRGSIITQRLDDDGDYTTHRQQTKRKGLNAPLRIKRWRSKGISVPCYDRGTPDSTARERLVERIVSSLLWLGRFRAFRYPLIKFLTSRWSIPLIKLRLWLKKRKYRS